MSSSDALWLNLWETIGTIGFVLVIIGVIIEGVEHFKKFPKKEHARKLQIEKLGWYVVVIGLAMEFWGDHAAKRISERESARLNKEAGDARKEAQQFRLRASQLEAKIQTRTIAHDKRDKFVNLLAAKQKVPVRVLYIGEGLDTRPYAEQIREMLDAAGYKVPGPIINGFGRELALSVGFFAQTTNIIPPSVFLGIKSATNNPDYMPAIQNALYEIGIEAPFVFTSADLKPGEMIVLVTSKL